MAVWDIEEPEAFFMEQISIPVTPYHPAKRLQHLAGRYLLKLMHPDFPLEAIQSKSGEKPFLYDQTYQFSISHSGKIATAITSKMLPVGIDVEIITEKALRVAHKFLSAEEVKLIEHGTHEKATILWSIKETVFKWYGLGSVDFIQDIQIKNLSFNQDENSATCFFRKTDQIVNIHFIRMEDMVVSWMVSSPLVPPDKSGQALREGYTF